VGSLSCPRSGQTSISRAEESLFEWMEETSPGKSLFEEKNH
jgi:hypothetical protein